MIQLIDYKHLWEQKDVYCLGPVDEVTRELFKWQNDYSIYQRGIFQYIPVNISDANDIRAEVIAKMIHANCDIISQYEIDNRSDITRMWKDRKDEFVVKLRNDFTREYYVIEHRLLNQLVRIKSSSSGFQGVIRKMIDAGVDVIKEDEFALKRRVDGEGGYDIIHQFSNKVIFSEYSGAKRDAMIKQLLEAGVKIIEEDK